MCEVVNESTLRCENVEITWLKHAGFQIRGAVVIYIDPYDVSGELEKADIILVTHGHFDHMDTKSIKALSKDDTIIVHPKGCKVEGKTYEVSIGDVINVKGVEIKAVPAYNVNKPYHKKGEGVGYILKVDNIRIYHAGDTDRIPEMKEIEVDVALLPIGGTYTMDVDEAIKAAKDIKAKIFVPMHYGEIGLKADPEKFKASVDNAVILKPLLS